MVRQSAAVSEGRDKLLHNIQNRNGDSLQVFVCVRKRKDLLITSSKNIGNIYPDFFVSRVLLLKYSCSASRRDGRGFVCVTEKVFSQLMRHPPASRICCAAFCLHLLACWANGSRTWSFWLTWYILKGMYLKPPSSVEYSISFLFMAQNWSNLSVTGQKQKPVSNSSYTSVFSPNGISPMCRISKIVMFLIVHLLLFINSSI